MRLITKKYVKKLEENVKVREQRRMEESRVETVYIIRPNHLNAAGRLFGGMLVQWIDEVAGIVAMRHTRENCITASIDNLKFIRGAYLGGTCCNYRTSDLCWEYFNGSASGYICGR